MVQCPGVCWLVSGRSPIQVCRNNFSNATVAIVCFSFQCCKKITQYGRAITFLKKTEIPPKSTNPLESAPSPSGSTQAAAHSSWEPNRLRFPSQPPYQKRLQAPNSTSKYHLTVKLTHGPRSLGRPHTSGMGEGKASWRSLGVFSFGGKF